MTESHSITGNKKIPVISLVQLHCKDNGDYFLQIPKFTAP